MSKDAKVLTSDFPVGTAPSSSDLAELPTENFILANDNRYINYLQLPDVYFQPHRAWQYFGLTGGVRTGSYTLPAKQVGISQDFVFEGLEYRIGPSATLPLGLKGPALFGEVVYYTTGPQSYKHNAWVQTAPDENPDMGMPGDEAPDVTDIESYSSPTTHLDRSGIGWAVGVDVIPPNALGVLSLFDARLAYEGTYSKPNHASEDPSWPTAALPFTADGVGQTTPAELLDVTTHAVRADVGVGFLKLTGSLGFWDTTRHNPEDTGGTGQYVTTEGSTLQASEVTDDTSVLHGNFYTAGVTADLSGIAMPRLKAHWGTDDYVGIYLDGDKDGMGAQYVDALHASQTGPLFFVRESRYQKLREQAIKDHPTDVAAQYSQFQAALIKEAKHQYPKVNVISVEPAVYAAILGSEKLPKSANVQVLYDLYLQDPAGFAEARESYIQSCKEAEDAVRAKVNAKLERQGKATDDDDAKKARIAAVKAYANKHNDRAGYLILIPRDQLADARGGTFWLTTDATDCDDQNTDPENDCRRENTYYKDIDGDGYAGSEELKSKDATPPAGYFTTSTDCDDSNPAIHPGATDIPGNGIIEDCVADGVVEEVPPPPPPPQIAISLRNLILEIGHAQYEDLLGVIENKSYEFRLGETELKNENERAEFAAAVAVMAATNLPFTSVIVIGKADQDKTTTKLSANTYLAMMRAGIGLQILNTGWAASSDPASLPAVELQFNPATQPPVYQVINGAVVKKDGKPVEVSSDRGFSFVPVLNEQALEDAATELNTIAENEVNALYLAFTGGAVVTVDDPLFKALVTAFQSHYPLKVVRERNYAVLLEALSKSNTVGSTHALYKLLVSQEAMAAIMVGAEEHVSAQQDEHYQMREIQANKTNTVSFTVPGLSGVDPKTLVIYGDWETKDWGGSYDPTFKIEGDQLIITLPTAKGRFTSTGTGVYQFYVAQKPYTTTTETVDDAHKKEYPVYCLTVKVVPGEPTTYVEPVPHGGGVEIRIVPHADASQPTITMKNAEFKEKLKEAARIALQGRTDLNFDSSTTQLDIYVGYQTDATGLVTSYALEVRLNDENGRIIAGNDSDYLNDILVQIGANSSEFSISDKKSADGHVVLTVPIKTATTEIDFERAVEVNR